MNVPLVSGQLDEPLPGSGQAGLGSCSPEGIVRAPLGEGVAGSLWARSILEELRGAGAEGAEGAVAASQQAGQSGPLSCLFPGKAESLKQLPTAEVLLFPDPSPHPPPPFLEAGSGRWVLSVLEWGWFCPPALP